MQDTQLFASCRKTQGFRWIETCRQEADGGAQDRHLNKDATNGAPGTRNMDTTRSKEHRYEREDGPVVETP